MKKEKNIDLGLFILRLSIGGMMLLHGLHKLQAPADSVNFLSQALSSSGLPEFMAYGVFLGEVIAPLIVIIGWRTRIFATIIAFTMLIAIFTAHSADIFSLGGAGGWAIELQALYLFGSLALFLTGGGRLALSSNNKWD